MNATLNSNKPKKKNKIWRRIGIWYLTVFIIGIATATISPKNADGTTIVPDWYENVMIFVPIAVAFFYDKIKWRSIVETIKNASRKNATKKSRVDADNFVPPRPKAAQEAIAEDLGKRIGTSIAAAASSSNVLTVIASYDEVTECYAKFKKLDKIAPNAAVLGACRIFEDEFQLYLCNAIVSQKDETIVDIKGKYKNSREFQRKALEEFERDINLARHKFSIDTAQLADESCNEIKRIIGIGNSQDDRRFSMNQQFFEYGGADAELLSVDLMEGHAFESWCADLLKKNGYTDVEVTPGSGDQGVDILATKDGIKFAIQCKRYNSDLGNTPVQEVVAGRKFYHCQVGVVMTNRYFTAGAKELAETTGTLLWDRDKLQDFMQVADHL